MAHPQKKTLTKKKEGMRAIKRDKTDKAKKITGKKPQSFQDSVNVGLAEYQRTSTPSQTLGSQANINSLPSVYDVGFKNKTIKKLSKSQVMGAAIEGIFKSVL